MTPRFGHPSEHKQLHNLRLKCLFDLVESKEGVGNLSSTTIQEKSIPVSMIWPACRHGMHETKKNLDDDDRCELKSPLSETVILFLLYPIQ